MNNTKARKTTKGRQKIEIKKIENNGNRQVTFTKRRGGLFKKAGELCILTDAEVAVIVKSPGGRIFTFAQPDIGTLAERRFGSLRSSCNQPVVTDNLTKCFNGRYDDVVKELEAEKRRSVLIAGSNSPNGGFWWQEPLDGIPLEGLESRVAAMEEMIKNLIMKGDQMMLMAASNPMHYSSAMLAINTTSYEIKNDQLANYPFINQPHDYSLVPKGYNFGHDHVA